MHLLSAYPLSELAPASSAAMRVAIGNATGHCDYTLELVPVQYIRMLDRTDGLASIGEVNATMSPTCLLGSMVVLLQMTLVLQGIVMSREIRPFVVDHLRSLSKDYLRLTPLWHALPRGAIVE